MAPKDELLGEYLRQQKPNWTKILLDSQIQTDKLVMANQHCVDQQTTEKGSGYRRSNSM